MDVSNFGANVLTRRGVEEARMNREGAPHYNQCGKRPHRSYNRQIQIMDTSVPACLPPAITACFLAFSLSSPLSLHGHIVPNDVQTTSFDLIATLYSLEGHCLRGAAIINTMLCPPMDHVLVDNPSINCASHVPNPSKWDTGSLVYKGYTCIQARCQECNITNPLQTYFC
jgi:hypothetical protein